MKAPIRVLHPDDAAGYIDYVDVNGQDVGPDHILLRVNTHDQLVSALRAAHKALDHFSSTVAYGDEVADPALDEIEKALKAAGEWT